MFGLRQFSNNLLSKEILDYLGVYCHEKDIPNQSFISQIKEVIVFTELDFNSWNETIELIDRRFQCNDSELRQLISTILNNFKTSNIFFILIY